MIEGKGRPKQKEGTEVKCQHCGYIWHTKSKADFYTTCPKCGYRVPYKKRILSKLE